MENLSCSPAFQRPPKKQPWLIEMSLIHHRDGATFRRAELQITCSSLTTLKSLFCTWLKIQRGHKFKCTSKCGYFFSTEAEIIILRWKTLFRFSPSSVPLRVVDSHCLTFSSHLTSAFCQVLPTLLKISPLHSCVSELVHSFFQYFHIFGCFTLVCPLFSVYFHLFHLAVRLQPT